MQITNLYSDLPSIFNPIRFYEDRVNIIYAEITDRSNLKKDTHNLGKTLLVELIDFMLLKKVDKEHFLLKHKDIFQDFTFFIELKLPGDRGYLTIRRSVRQHTKISMIKQGDRDQDYSDEVMDIWDHHDIPLGKAKQILEAYLSLTPIKPWSYRLGLSYFLRSQADYTDVFQLSKFKKRHKDWKPYLFQILGFDGLKVKRMYEIEDDVTQIELQINSIKNEYPGSIDPIDKLNGKMLLIDQEIEGIESSIGSYNFKEADDVIMHDLITKIESSISALNQIRYSMDVEIKTIRKQLEIDYIEDFEKTRKLFAEAKIYFSDQLSKDYDELITFNRVITSDRKQYLKSRYDELIPERKQIENELVRLNEERQRSLSILKESDTGKRIREYQDKLVQYMTQRELLRKMKDIKERIDSLEAKITDLMIEKSKRSDDIESDLKNRNTTYEKIRLLFSQSIKEVLGKDALISITRNKSGNFDFEAEITDTGQITSQSKGTSYKQILCTMFDLSILQAYVSEPFYKFVYHDGVLERLDNRKKIQLLNYVSRICIESKIQSIITVIDSDWPHDYTNETYMGNVSIVLQLHDRDDTGRLFKIKEF